MYVDLLDVGVEGRLEVDLGLVTWSTDLDFARCTPAKCGEAGKSVSERAGITRSSARALTGEHGSVAHSSTFVRRRHCDLLGRQVLRLFHPGTVPRFYFLAQSS